MYVISYSPAGNASLHCTLTLYSVKFQHCAFGSHRITWFEYAAKIRETETAGSRPPADGTETAWLLTCVC